MRALVPLRRAFASAAGADKLGAVKRLRERTGAPIVDVKNALAAHDYDAEAALDHLRASGLAAAAKKAHRASADGVVCATTARANGAWTCAIAEVNSETDFVARNETFRALARAAATATATRLDEDAAFASECGTIVDGRVTELSEERLGAMRTTSGKTLGEMARETAVSVRENVRVRRAAAYAATAGSEEVIGTYVHGALAPGVGRQAACVVAKGVSVDFANKLAMHVVASAPAYLRGDCVPNDVYEREMAVYRSQTEGSGKPANIVEKILAGRMNKFYEEVCLENQKFVLDDSVTVGKAVKAEGGERIAFTRMKVGEGIDVEEKDFASEVAEAVRSTT